MQWASLPGFRNAGASLSSERVRVYAFDVAPGRCFVQSSQVYIHWAPSKHKKKEVFALLKASFRQKALQLEMLILFHLRIVLIRVIFGST